MKKLLILVVVSVITLSGFARPGAGDIWNHRIITYFFQNNPNDLNATAARNAVRTAFRTWQDQARVYFIEVCTATEADIVISWETGNHGDGKPFDGQGGKYAHSFFPPPGFGVLDGDIHFDDDEDWTDAFRPDDGQPLDLQTVALHEIGHSLGLSHINVNGAVMVEGYRGSRRVLIEADIYAIRQLYGAPEQIISGNNYICGSSTYTIAEPLPAGHTLTWTTDNPAVTVTPGGVVSANGFVGTVNLTATITNGCGTLVFTRAIQTGTVQSPTFSGMYYTEGWNGVFFYEYPGTNPCYATRNVTTNVTFPAGCTVTWSLVSPANPSGTWSTAAGGNINFIIYNVNEEWTFNVTISNNCGSVLTKQYKWKAQQQPIILPNPDDCLKYGMYPNPSKGKVTVGETSKPAPGPCPLGRTLYGKGATITQINVYSIKGILLKRVRPGIAKQTSLDMMDLANGQYIIEIIENSGYTERQILLLQK